MLNPNFGSLCTEEAVNTFRRVLELPGMVNRKAGASHRNRYHQDRDHKQFHHQPGFPGVRGILRRHAEQAQACVGDTG